MYLLPMFFRPLRPVVPFAMFAVFLRARDVVRCFRVSLVFRFMVFILLFLIIRLFVQMFFSEIESYSVALRQLAYYVIFPTAGVVSGVMIFRHNKEMFSAAMIAAAMFEYAFLSLTHSAVFAGGMDIRGNFEAGAAYFYVAFVFLLASRKWYLLLFFILYAVFSEMTRSAQGVIAVMSSFMIFFTWGIVRKLVLMAFGALPLAFPVFFPVVFAYVRGLDSNVNFRYDLWSSLFRYLNMQDGLGGLGFGLPIYKTVLANSGLPYFNYEQLNNVGMHNAVLQLGAFAGVFGIAVGVMFLFVATRVAVRNSADIRIGITFCVFSISLTFNQAISHLAVGAGTALLAGVLIFAELRQAAEKEKAPEQNRQPDPLPDTSLAGGRL